MKKKDAGASPAKKEVVLLEYEKRINRALEYIRRNLDGDLSVEAVARAAPFSPFHFHRIFKALVGETLHAHIRRLRLERGALILITNPLRPVTDVAFDCGFQTPSSFARAFRERFEMSASEWRAMSKNRKAVRKNGKAPPSEIGEDGSHQPFTLNQRRCEMKVEVKELPARRVAYVRHMGGYEEKGIHETWETLCGWAGPRGLLGPKAVMIGVSWDDPDVTPPEKCRYDACVAVGAEVQPEGKVGVREIQGGRHAVYRFEGTAADYPDTYRALYGEWLPKSGYRPGDAPCYEIYYKDPDSEPKGQFISDICIPVAAL